MTKKNNIELYENFHKDTNVFNSLPDEKDFTLLNHVPLYKKYIDSKDKVLDIGCGSGLFSLWASTKCNYVIGMDISDNAIRKANKSKELLGIKNIEFFNTDFMMIEENQSIGKYDVVMLTEVLEHLPDDYNALLKIHKLIKKGGYLLISVPSKNAPLHKNNLRKYNGKDPFDFEVGHLRRYTEDAISKLVKESGFEIIQLKLCEGYLRNWLYNDKRGQYFMRFNKYFIKYIVKFIDEKIFLPLFGESDIILVTKKL